jgi:hypothetical protein
MSTYTFKITLDDSEITALDAALKMLIEHSDKELELSKSNGNSPQSSFWAYKHSAEGILKRLYKNPSMSSFNTFGTSNNQQTFKILIANDKQLYREAQKLAIKKVSNLQIVGEVINFNGLFDRINQFNPDILITHDVILGENVSQYLSDIKKLYPGLKILVTSHYEENIKHLAMLRKEANGLLVGVLEAEDFIEGIKLVLNGQPCYWHGLMWHN